ARGEDMDHRGDLYSVGVTLYEVLSGRLPFAGRCTMDVLLAHATEEPPSFAEIGVGDRIPPGIEAVVQACPAKNATDRPSNARELSERYDGGLAESPPLQDSGVRSGMHSVKAPGRNGEAAASAAVASVALSAPAYDPNTIVHFLEAWMPEKIAAFKLRGFVQDVGGEILECVPGRIRVRVGGRGSVYASRGSLSWLGLGRRSGPIDLEMQLQRSDPNRESQLRITVM